MGAMQRFWEKVDELEAEGSVWHAVGELAAMAAFAGGWISGLLVTAQLMSGPDAGLMIALLVCIAVAMAGACKLVVDDIFRIIG